MTSNLGSRVGLFCFASNTPENDSVVDVVQQRKGRLDASRMDGESYIAEGTVSRQRRNVCVGLSSSTAAAGKRSTDFPKTIGVRPREPAAATVSLL